MLGHKSIQNTLRYIQLQTAEDEAFHCNAARTLSEVAALVEAGFEFVCKLEDGLQVFRKRK